MPEPDHDLNLHTRGLSLKLGPQFLSLVIVNVLVLGILFWFVDARAKHTAHIMDQLMASCPQLRPVQ